MSQSILARRLSTAAIFALVASLLLAVPSGAQTEPRVVDYDLVADDVSDAVQTSLLLSDAAFDAADTVLLATAADGADALSSGVLQDDSPLLYVDPAEGLLAEHRAEITRLGANTVVIIGGTAAVSQEIEDALVADGLTVQRLAGAARIETANAVAAYEDTLAGDTAVHLSRAFGSETDPAAAFADAAGLGAWAAQSGVVTVLTQTDAVAAATGAFYDANEAITRTVTIGGTAAVADSVLEVLAAEYAQDVSERVFSETNNNRAGTAIAINDARGLDPAALAGVVAVDGYNGDYFVDAYALSALAGNSDYAVVLTNGGQLPPETQAYLAGGGFAQDTATDVVCMPNVDEAACDAVITATGNDPANKDVVTVDDLGAAAEQVDTVEITAPATAAPATDFDITVDVTDADGAGIEGVEVSLTTDPASAVDGETATTDADGVATFADLQIADAGSYEVTADAAGVTDTATITVAAVGGGGGFTPTPTPQPAADEVWNTSRTPVEIYTGQDALQSAIADAADDEDLLAGAGPFDGGVTINQEDLSIESVGRTSVDGAIAIRAPGVNLTDLDIANFPNTAISVQTTGNDDTSTPRPVGDPVTITDVSVTGTDIQNQRGIVVRNVHDGGFAVSGSSFSTMASGVTADNISRGTVSTSSFQDLRSGVGALGDSSIAVTSSTFTDNREGLAFVGGNATVMGSDFSSNLAHVRQYSGTSEAVLEAVLNNPTNTFPEEAQVVDEMNGNFAIVDDFIADGDRVLNTTRGTSFQTIQAAIDDSATQDGDLLLAYGAFDEDPDITKSVSLAGRAGATLTGGFRSTAPGVSLSSFDISDLRAFGGDVSGIYVSSGTITATDITITGTNGAAERAVVTESGGGGTAILFDCAISDVTSGVYLNPTGALEMSNCSINDVVAGVGGDEYRFVDIDDSSFTGASNEAIAFAPASDDIDDLTISNSTFAGNAAHVINYSGTADIDLSSFAAGDSNTFDRAVAPTTGAQTGIYSTIVDGVTRTPDSGTVRIFEGDYAETFVLNRGINVVAVDGPDATHLIGQVQVRGLAGTLRDLAVVPASPTGTAVSVTDTTADVALDGVRLTGSGTGQGRGISAGPRAVVTIDLTDSALANFAVGVSLDGGAGLAMTGGSIQDSNVGVSAPTDSGGASFDGVTISGNTVEGVGFVAPRLLSVINSTFGDNGAALRQYAPSADEDGSTLQAFLDEPTNTFPVGSAVIDEGPSFAIKVVP